MNIKSAFNSNNYQFLIGAHNYSQVPKHKDREVAFIGASNVGKSSLINCLVGKKIAITSTVPGRTRQLNFFKGANFTLVDMPGYGYAKAKEKHISHWQKVSLEYVKNRANLKRVFLLIGAEKDLKKSDLEIIETFNAFAISFQLILTKIDKISQEKSEKLVENIENAAKKWPAAYPEIIATSADKGYGVKSLQNQILQLIRC